MGDSTRIVFDGIWKKFRRGEVHDSLRDLIPSLVRRTVQRADPTALGKRDFWALRDVSFQVDAGRALGIIGRNGAGKSTTLKILTRILAPTRGTYMTAGRVGALIEVAAGFHPDLTGRENIYLQAAILGMSRERTDRVFDSIVDFAGVEAFIDTPVKRYSSGMNARLGFAIAAHFDPDVLIIDEVLSVGDMAFQAKCIERMHAFKREGVAIVFVSHNMQAVSDLCDDALQLDGEVVRRGTAGDVVNGYLQGLERGNATVGHHGIALESSGLAAAGAPVGESVAPGAALQQQLTIAATETAADCSLIMIVRRATDGLQVFERWYSCAQLGMSTLLAGEQYTVEAGFSANVSRGVYQIEWTVYHNPTSRVLARLAPAAIFRVDEYESRNSIADLGVEIGATSRP